MAYEIELINLIDNCFHRITFNITRREDILPTNCPNPLQWKIFITKIDSTAIIDGNATAYCTEYQNNRIILQYIEYKNVRYTTDTKQLYLFPMSSLHPLCPPLQEGSMLITVDTIERSIVVQPLDVLPFMDMNGAFHYEYVAIYREDENGKWCRCKKPVTLYQVNDEYKALWDKKTKKIYSIQNAFTFITPAFINQ